MSRNIKEIGKELLGKSLNSFHRKTGLTQLEKNNEMQDGILDGILSQVDDAYIEKTEQSNVIHLDGSGDGVVVVDGIEGNTLINLWEFNNLTDGYFVSNNGDTFTNFFTTNVTKIKPNQKYTFITEIVENTLVGNSLINFINDDDGQACFSDGFRVDAGKIGVFKTVLTTKSDLSNAKIVCRSYIHNSEGTNAKVKVRCILIEGEHLNKEINYFTGLQSSFEEQKEEDKYKIEILSNNKNLFNINTVEPKFSSTNDSQYYPSAYYIKDDSIVFTTSTSYQGVANLVKVQKGKTYTFYSESPQSARILLKPCDINNKYVYTDTIVTSSTNKTITFIAEHDYYWFMFDSHSGASTFTISNIQMQEGSTLSDYVPHKQNKIKLLLNEPLRAVGDVKDRLCIKDNTLVVERNFVQILVNGENLQNYSNFAYRTLFDFKCNALKNYHLANFITDSRFKNSFTDYQWNNRNEESIAVSPIGEGSCIDIIDKSTPFSVNSYKEHLKENPIKVVCQLLKPYYEEVPNEYGEPVLLEGYENGTLYIDSTIVPTTTVRYTPKMESFKTLKEVNKNNNLITLDINENIIPYMMDVDYMIMEKELCLLNTKNIRKMEELDMTSMQKRTQDMLERLIKGKTLTEQECKTRVTTYLNAGKITDEQAEELMLLIDEVYA